ncbi:MBL fold metallo-hydrolase [Micromonospora zamorensis]|uniref:MBL fold metallo-hydrolase n=1 Tax=Micromonospora zamorensis TaxID=709883 RepID=UPI002E2377AE
MLDPLWSNPGSQVPGVGPKRLHPMPVALADLPRLDAIVISHDRYGHLDMPAIRALNHTQEAILVAHPRRHRVSPLRSRAFIGSNETLWSSWVIVGSIGWSSTPAISAPSTARRRRRAAWSFRRDADADRPVDAGTHPKSPPWWQALS